MLSTLILVAQGALVGFMAGQAFPGHGLEFWVTIVVNSVLVVTYGQARKTEDY